MATSAADALCHAPLSAHSGLKQRNGQGRKPALKLRFMAIEMRRMKSGSGCRGFVDC